MKKKLITLLMLFASMVPVAAQDEKSHILVNKVDGTVDTLLLNNVRDIYHSCLDINGVEQSDITTLRLRMVDGERVYSLSEIDHLVMPKFGRIISFTGTTQLETSSSNGRRRTSLSGDALINDDGTVKTGTIPYFWTADDIIYLPNGDKSNKVSTSGSSTGSFTFRSDSLVADQYIVYYPGQKQDASSPYNRVIIPDEQTQTGANNSDHLGASGDCGTAVAYRQSNSNYSFSLGHKSAVICFMPRVEAYRGTLLKTLQLKHVAVKADKNIAGTYTLSPEGIELVEGTGRDTVTLYTNNFEAHLPHQKATAQDSVASYMVVSPQTAKTTMKVYYRVYDTYSDIDTTIMKNISIATIDGSKVYPVTSLIPPATFQAAVTDSVKWNFGGPATLYGSVNYPGTATETVDAKLIWGFDKNLDFETKEGELSFSDIRSRTFSGKALDNVRQRAYYYRAYALDGGKAYWGNVKKFGMNREIIDLGTSVKWASLNLGAVSSEDIGNYYAWGELTPNKGSYTKENYAYYIDANTFTEIGDEIVGNPLYDAATYSWGGCWRMPTYEELQELTSNQVDKITATLEGQEGYLYKKKNGTAADTMFLPKAGYYNGTSLESPTMFRYWSGTRQTNVFAWTQYNYNNTSNNYKFYGMPIRPVFDSNKKAADGTCLFIRTDSIHYNATQTEADMYGTMRGLDDDVTELKQGFVIGTAGDVVLETAVANRPITYEQDATANGSYHIHLNTTDVDKLELGVNYYLRAYVKYGDEPFYGDPFEIAALTVVTDSTNWQVGKTSARLCATAGGITPSVKDNVELGFVIGTTADVTHATAGHIELLGESVDADKNGKFVAVFPDIEMKQYYYRAFVRQRGGRVFYSDNVKMLGLEMVDLGLPSGLRWSNLNIGAASPENYGGYYAWGETATKSSYVNNSTNYSHYRENIGTDIAGNPDYDAAQVNWKSVWRMPTKAEAEELINYCDWEYMTIDGVGVYKLTSKVSGYTDRFIYLPCAGLMDGSTFRARLGYWTSTVAGDSESGDYAWLFDNNGNTSKALALYYTGSYRSRFYGYPIRPVAMPNDTLPDNSIIRITTDSVDWEVGQTTATLHGYLLGLHYNENATEAGFVYSTSPMSGTPVTELPAAVSRLKGNYGQARNVASGSFTANMTDIADQTLYFYRAYVVVDGTYYFADERQFGRKSVDLGLPSGLLWSNINVGASSPDLSGNYYAWGKTTTSSDYSRASYDSPQIGPDISSTANDVAHTEWGSTWQMPTPDDIQELIDNCTWTEVTKYGQPMYKIEGNGDSIFIAKHGFMNGTARSGDQTTVALWTSVLNDHIDANNERAYATSFYDQVFDINLAARYLGYAVRPVSKTNHELADHTRFYLTTDRTNWQVGNTTVQLNATLSGLEDIDSETLTYGFVVGYVPDVNTLQVGGANVTNVNSGITASDNTFFGTIAYDKDTRLKDTTYFYRAYVKVGDEYVYGNVRRYGLSLIDMGKGIKWASINMGAQTSSDYGNRYAWGELSANKNSYTEHTYDYYNNGFENIGSDISGTTYDVAKSDWGGTWRMPTYLELQTLTNTDDYTWTWTTEDGVAGYLVTSKVEGTVGNSIFLPAAGYQTISRYESLDTDCYYWSSSLYSGSESYLLHAASSSLSLTEFGRFYGLSVRPVTTAGSGEGGGGDITGGHNSGNSHLTEDDNNGQGGGNAGTGGTGGAIGD